MSITYTPQYRLANLGSFTAMPSTTLTTATFTPLAAGTSYDFRIVADNGVGKSTSVPFTQMTTAVSESAQNASITQSNYTTTFIYDANLTQWSLQTPNSFSIYSSPPPYTALTQSPGTNSVILLLYWNHTVYQENSGGSWWSWNGTGWTPTSDPRPIISSVNLSNNTFPQGAGAGTVVGNVTVTENTGNTFSGTLGVTGTDRNNFTINSSNQLVTVGSVPVGGPWNINIVATSNQLGAQNSPFTQAESISETGGESIEGAVVNTVGPIMYASTNFGTASTGALNQFELQTSTSSGNQIYINTGSGFVLTNSSGVSQLVYHKNTVFQQNNVGGWWYWNTTVAFPTNNPWTGFSVDSVALGATTYPSGATAGTQIGAITVRETGGTFGGTFGGTLALSGTNASLFRISGSNLVVNTGVTLSTNTATNYSFTITAKVASGGSTPTTIGTSNTGTITLTNSKAATGPTPPTQVTSAFGSNPTLAFNSDFTSTTDVTGDTTAASGFFWYPGLDFDTTYTVNTTATAASINNGNVGGGNNASPAGGILTLLTQNVGSGYSGMFVTLPFNPLNFNGAVLPAVGQGHWSHAYFETYMQFVSNGNTGLAVPNGPATGGPAFWSWAAQDLAGYGAGGSSLIASPSAEVDFMEHFGTMFHGSNTWETTLREWQGSNLLASTQVATGTTDSNWHTYGMLWKSTGTGTGSLTMYVDNVQQGSPLATFTEMESQTLFIVLGTGNQNWNTNFDWVRVWTPGAVSQPTAPTQAANAGFHNLVFSDDFTDNTTIATTSTASSGYKWYWSINAPDTNGSWTVLNTTAASGISNGNTGGGSNASPAGGILRIDTGAFPSNGDIQTVPRYLNSVPALGTGNWRHMYVEAYLQFRFDGNTSTDPATGWPGFWMWDTADLNSLGTGYTSGSQGTSTELDIMESYGTLYGNTSGNWDSTWHYPAGSSTAATWATNPPRVDNNWHTWGCLWTPGTISTYLDNVLIGSFSTTTLTPDVENQGVILILGTGNQWPLHVDWVKVWQ